jgi:hypothetical protein
MKKAGNIFLFWVFGCAAVFGQVQPDPRVLVKQAGAVTDDLLQWDGAKWTPGRADVAVVADSAAFRAFNVAISPKLIVMTDSLRGGKFRRCYICTADQYMVFTDAFGRKWERFDYGNSLFTEWFGSKGDSATSDNVSFRKTFEFIAANPINTIRLNNKKYVLTGTITGTFGTAMTKGVTITGEANTHIINKGTASKPFEFLNTEINLTLSANQVEGRNWVRASGITNLRSGDLVFISSSEVPESGWGYTANDVHVIHKINGDTLFFRNNLNFNYTTGTVTVFKGYKDRKVNISNIKFINDVAALSGVMHLSGLKGTTIDNVSIKYNTNGTTIYNAAQILNYKCVDGVYTNIEINNAAYGLDVSSSRNSVIKNIKGNYSYGLAVPASWGDGFFVDNMSGNKVTVDGHPSFNVHYKNVNITNGGAAIRSLGVNVENMIITNTDSSEVFVFEMSGLMNDPYKSKIPYYPTILKNVQILCNSKNASVQTVDQNSTIYFIDGLVTNDFFVSRKTNIASADNLSIGYLRSWKPNVQYNNLVFDGRFTPSWATGFIKQDQAPLKINGLAVKNAVAKTLFTHYNTAYNCHINNGVIDTILSIGNGTTASSLTGLVLQNCQLKNFASASNNIAEFRNVEFDNSVSTASINTSRELPEWTNFTSNTYQNTGINIENTQGSGIPQVNLIAGGASGFQGSLGLRGGTGSLVLLNKRNDAGRVDIGVTIASIEEQKIRVDYNGNVGIGGVSAPTEPLQVGGNIRVAGAYKDSNNEPGTSGQILSTTGTGTDWINASDNNGIYSGSGTVPNNTTATLTDDFTISGNDATGTQSAKFRVVATGTDPGVQTWRVGADSVEMVFLSGEPTLRAAGTSGNDFWITGGANDLRLNGLSVQTHAVKNVLGGYLAVPYVSTSANLTVSEGTAEVDVVGTSGTITLTFDNTSNLFGSAAKTITVWNRGAFNVTLSRGAQAWEWSDMTGTNTASNQTLAAGETAKMLWVDAGVTDYYVLHKMPATFSAGGYATVQEEGASVTQRTIINFVGSTATASDNTTKTDVTFDSDVNALASTASTGLYSVTGTGTSATRTITAPAAGITVSNGNGVSGNPTLALANDLSAVEGLASNGVAVRTGTDTWAVRTLTAGTGISISNGDGVSGNPTVSATAGGEVVISPSQLTAHTNDWNPTDLATATTIRISGDASFRMITGITAPSAAKQLKIINVGSNSLAFIKENTGSTAANRFTLDKDVVLLPGQVMSLYYDLTSARWRLDHVTIPTASLRNTSILFTPASATSSDFEQFAFASGSGGANSFVAPSSTVDAGAPTLSVSTGTSTTGVGYLSTKSLSAIVPNPTAGCTYFGALIYIPTASDGTNTFVVEAGLKASVTGGTGVNGYHFRYTHSENSGLWQNVVTISGTPTISSGSVAGSSGSFVLLEIMKRPDGTASYYIDGTRRVTVGSGPTQDLLPVVQIIKSAGTTDRAIQIRYVTTDLYIK